MQRRAKDEGMRRPSGRGEPQGQTAKMAATGRMQYLNSGMCALSQTQTRSQPLSPKLMAERRSKRVSTATVKKVQEGPAIKPPPAKKAKHDDTGVNLVRAPGNLGWSVTWGCIPYFFRGWFPPR